MKVKEKVNIREDGYYSLVAQSGFQDSQMASKYVKHGG